jgi:hypothetical protein
MSGINEIVMIGSLAVLGFIIGVVTMRPKPEYRDEIADIIGTPYIPKQTLRISNSGVFGGKSKYSKKVWTRK